MITGLRMHILRAFALLVCSSATGAADSTPWAAYWSESADNEALCRGSYSIPAPVMPADTAWMTLSGKRLEYDPQEGAEATGGVRLQLGERFFEAESANTLQGMSQLEFEGGVRYFEPGAGIWGERASYNIQAESVQLESLAFLLEDQVFSPDAVNTLPAIRGQAAHISLSRDEVRVENAWFTRCEPDSRGWRVSSETLTLDSSDAFATVTNARLEVAELPLLYVPWMKFPVTSERQSGWLYPDLRYEGQRGGVIRLPFYWNLAPNRDLVMMPGFEGRRGTSFGFEYRHATSNSRNRLIAHLLPDDQEFKADIPGESGRRYLVRARHSGQFGNLFSSLNLTALSDRRMHRERYDELGASHTRWAGASVTNEGHLLYSRDGWNLGIEMEQYRIDWNPNPDAYRTLPRIFFNTHKRFNSGWHGSVRSSWTRFVNDISERDFGEVTRIGSDLLLQYPLLEAWGGARARIGAAYTGFELHAVRDDRTTWRDGDASHLTSGFFELDANLRLERRWHGLRMSLEPRALYTYRHSEQLANVPLFDSVLREYSLNTLHVGRSYAGIDRYADTHQIALSLRSRVWNLASGRRFLEVEAGLIRSLAGDELLLARVAPDERTSPLAIRARSWLSDRLRVESSLTWQPDGERWFERGLWTSYRTPGDMVLRLGYRMRRYGEVFEQGEVAFDLPVSERLRIFAIYQHDFSQHELLTAVLGTSYAHCCWAVDIGLRRLLRRPDTALSEDAYHSNAVYLRLVFAGFAGVGDSISPLISLVRGSRYGW